MREEEIGLKISLFVRKIVIEEFGFELVVDD